MIDATKLPRPAPTAAAEKSQSRLAQRSGAPAGEAGETAADGGKISTQPAKGLVLDGGRYYAAGSKK